MEFLDIIVHNPCDIGFGTCHVLDDAMSRSFGQGPCNGGGHKFMVLYFQELLARRSSQQRSHLHMWLVGVSIVVASVFSGTECVVVPIGQLKQALETPCHLHICFSCEVVPATCDHIFSCAPGVRLLFRDARDLVRDVGLERASGGAFFIPELMDLCVVGFPCQDVSSFDVFAKHARSCCVAGAHRTGGVLQSMLSTCRKRHSWLIILEDVKARGGQVRSNCAEVQRPLSMQFDFVSVALLVDPLSVGPPQSRNRIYIVGVARHRPRAVGISENQFRQNIVQTFDGVRRDWVLTFLDASLLGRSHPSIIQNRTERVALTTKRSGIDLAQFKWLIDIVD